MKSLAESTLFSTLFLVLLPLAHASQGVVTEKSKFIVFSDGQEIVYRRCPESATLTGTLEEAKAVCFANLDRRYTEAEFDKHLSKCAARSIDKIEIEGLEYFELRTLSRYVHSMHEIEAKAKLACPSVDFSNLKTCPALSEEDQYSYAYYQDIIQHYPSLKQAYPEYLQQEARFNRDFAQKKPIVDAVKERATNEQYFLPTTLKSEAQDNLTCAIQGDDVKFDYFRQFQSQPAAFSFGCCQVQIVQKNVQSRDSIGNFMTFDTYRMNDCSGKPIFLDATQVTVRRGGVLYGDKNYSIPGLIEYNARIEGIPSEQLVTMLNACLK